MIISKFIIQQREDGKLLIMTPPTQNVAAQATELELELYLAIKQALPMIVATFGSRYTNNPLTAEGRTVAEVEQNLQAEQERRNRQPIDYSRYLDNDAPEPFSAQIEPTPETAVEPKDETPNNIIPMPGIELDGNPGTEPEVF